jgi:hypothetical protein
VRNKSAVCWREHPKKKYDEADKVGIKKKRKKKERKERKTSFSRKYRSSYNRLLSTHESREATGFICGRRLNSRR